VQVKDLHVTLVHIASGYNLSSFFEERTSSLQHDSRSNALMVSVTEQSVT